MTKAEAYEKYPMLKILKVSDLIALLEGAVELDDEDFADAIRGVLKETKEY